MSGYLQRLATSAARPERRVQPLVGGLYTRQPEQAIEESATTIVPRTASAPQHATPSPGHLSAATARSAGPRLSSDEPRMEETVVRSALVEPAVAPIPEERRRPQPVLVEQNSASVTRREERTEHIEPPARKTEATSSPDLLVALSQFINRPIDFQPDSSSKDQTLVGDLSESAENDEPLRVASLKPISASPVRTFARPPATQPQTPSPMRAGGEDIQIHIGRIDVIAVPQQVAPRPVAAPARRGPSLEEYLKSRDRRSR